MDVLVLTLMIVGGIVFIGGISAVLLSLAFYIPNASNRELERSEKADRQSGVVLNSQSGVPNSIHSAHTV